MRVALLILPGAAASTVTGPIEICQLANRLARQQGAVAPALSLTTVAEDLSPRARRGLILQADETLPTTRQDWVLISAAGTPEAGEFIFSEALIDWLKFQHRAGAVMASFCTGSFLLAQSGLLDGGHATTHWQFERLFRQRFPAVDLQIERLVTRFGRLYCAAGAHAWSELVLQMIEQHFGGAIANDCARLLVLERRRDSQLPYTQPLLARDHRDARVHAVQDWLAEHFHEVVKVDDLATLCHLGERHFKRRFKAATGYSPLHYLQQLRVRQAMRLLESTEHPIEAIAAAVGYQDPVFFRTIFRRGTDLTPAAYRERYRVTPLENFLRKTS